MLYCYSYIFKPLCTCVLRWADTVAVTFLVNGACNSGGWQPPVGAESVGGDWGVWAVEGPLTSIAVASSWAGFGRAAGCRVWRCEGDNRLLISDRRAGMAKLTDMVMIVM